MPTADAIDTPNAVPVPRAASSVVPLLLVGFAFFVSGASALCFENLWFAQASLAFGNSIWASSIVLSGFMAGMASGYGLSARRAAAVTKPFVLYVLLELLVAGSGVVLVQLLPALSSALAPLSARFEQVPLVLQSLRLVLAFALLLLPAAAMGMTLPLLIHALRAQFRGFGRALGILYGINTLGSVLGGVLTQTALIAALGVRNTAWVAAGGNVLAAVLVWLAGRSTLTEVVASPSPQPTAAGARSWPWLGAGLLSGAALLGLEVVFLRLLMLFVNDTDLAFTWVLACVLLGIGFGALLAGLSIGRGERVARHAGWFGVAAVLLLVASYRLELYLFWHRFRLDQSAFTLALPLVLPVSIMSGLLFAVLGAGLRVAAHDDAHAAGRLALYNTLGGVLGSLLAGFVLLPALGIERSVFAFGCVYALLALLVVLTTAQGWVVRAMSVALCALGLALFPFGALRELYLQASVGRWMRPGDRLVSVAEASGATFAYVVHNRNDKPLFDQLATNAYSMSVNDFAARRYMKQFVYLPRALHPRLRRALVIGYGIGNTVEALLEDPQLERVDVADTSRDALALSRQMHTRTGKSPLDDARVHVHIEDGRHYLEGHDEGYDLITGEPPPPVVAGVVNLYTREYFTHMRARLAPGGMASYWLPLMNLSAPSSRAIIAGFCAAFSDCSLWHGSARNFMLLGTREAVGPVSEEQFRAQWQGPSKSELEAVGFELPEQLGATFIGDAAYLARITANSAPVTDDRPKRIVMEGPREQRDALIWQWRDTRKARQRFLDSPLIARLWPESIRKLTVRQFENQRLINDLLFPEQTPARQTMVLHQVLHGTPLTFPVLLLLGSDPDLQRIVATLSAAELAKPEWQVHRVAAYLAQRDFKSALPILLRMPAESQPLPELDEYVETALARGAR